jgi:hypothetical protein
MMRTNAPPICACVAGTLVLLLDSGVPAQSQESPRVLVTIEGLASAYPSCSIVTFSVRNVSRQDLYLEVYPEDLEAGAWADVGCAYDLHDPRSRSIKRLLMNPTMMRPGMSTTVRYDRCSDYEWCVKPKYSKQDTRASRQGLRQTDANATSPVMQRIRVQVHARDGNSVRRIGIVRSDPFTRVPSAK